MAACISPKGEWIYCVGEDRYVYIMLMLDLSLYFLKFLIGKLVLFISSLFSASYHLVVVLVILIIPYLLILVCLKFLSNIFVSNLKS